MRSSRFSAPLLLELTPSSISLPPPLLPSRPSTPLALAHRLAAYPATWIFERNGPIADPCYHDSCDKSNRLGYSFEQISAHTKVAFATVWETAGGALP